MSSGSDKLKLNFQLTAHERHLEVRATAPGGECRAETEIPPIAILDQWAEHDLVSIPSAVLRPVGQILYQCLMTGDVVKLASDVLQEGRQLKQPVHFELRFDADQILLAQYPWEMIADEHGRFLVRTGLIDVTRYITYPQPPPVLDAMPSDLPLLRLVSQPVTLPPITAVDLAIERIETLPHATFQQLHHRLLIERMELWGLHFDGHGGLMLRCRTCEALHSLNAQTCFCGASLSDAKRIGALAFERNGDVEWITAAELASVLYNAQVRLAVLLACETARVGDYLIFNGLAPGLILAGVPAVVGMQYPVTDGFAGNFASSFYAALLEQKDVLDAFRTARQMNMRETWYSPVLYLRHQPAKGEPIRSVYHTRKIDTAVPAEVQAGVPFLVRLWIRRPETESLTQMHLREELAIPDSVPISTREAEAEVKFEPIGFDPVKRRTLRRGEVDVKLSSPHCDVTPESISLFVDEHLDAPPAIFTVQAKRIGRAPLLFSMWQDGGQIAAVTHNVRVLDGEGQPRAVIETNSTTVPVQGSITEIGRTIKRRYQILEEIDRGGVAVVYKARDLHLGLHVILKFLLTPLVFDAHAVSHFERVLQATARLNHPHIARIYNWGEQAGTHYIVMDHTEGQPLAQLIQEQGPLSPDLALSILGQVADALDYAHSHGLLHGDIKPANIMVRTDGWVTLTDFGIATVATGTEPTRTGMTVGTPEYMAPEQVLGENVGAPADIYALGIVAYEMLGGRCPFQGNTWAVLHAQVTSSPPALGSLNPAVPQSVEAAINRALTKEPSRRFSRAGDFIAALQGAQKSEMPALQGAQKSEMPALPMPPPQAAGPARRGGRLWLLLLVVVLMLSALAVAAYLLIGHGQ